MTRTILRYLCLLTALANAGGNLVILLFYRPIFALLDVPLPADKFAFACVSGFSFTVGVLAYLVYRDPENGRGLLLVGAIGKGIYCLFTLYFFYTERIHWFYLVFGIWDGVFAVVFSLFLIHLLSPKLARLHKAEVLPGSGERTQRALVLYYSLSGNGEGAIARVQAGLESKGYTVDRKEVEPVEPVFRFPFKLIAFLRIALRAIFRRPAPIKPLGIATDHRYDLIIVECPTWFVGMAAPLEAVFQDPTNHGIFAGRDVAVVNVCRGLWRRTQAMTISWLETCRANVVGARAFATPGWEPARTLSLFIFLAAGAPNKPAWLKGFLQSPVLGKDSLDALERFGADLALRPNRSAQ
ncbi:MAG: hypothetical protein HOW73_10505 [Polyangiaceae bacterium]|nr:hypothetical protein [Polyangiaceae bacterium]